ncbi:MAG: penicillin-binding protein transpeptidase [Candidatus Solibacter sp.]|nr:penicillin-binding protein transpeptidase [Candidatus Solibacter sp.]
MLRRHAIATLFAAGTWPFAGAHGGAVLLSRKTRRVLLAELPTLAAPPGSTLKPLILQTLITRGRLRPDESFPCPRDLQIAGRSFACTHPPLSTPMTVRTAIAYSCNCFTAHVAVRFTSAELTLALEDWGLDAHRAPLELQALGEEGVIATPATLAGAYTRFAEHIAPAIKAGMEDAVTYGTAQRAQVVGLSIAGKTGSGRNAAWFAGFTDDLAIAVLVQGRSGGADAAPIAARILKARGHA